MADIYGGVIDGSASAIEYAYIAQRCVSCTASQLDQSG